MAHFACSIAHFFWLPILLKIMPANYVKAYPSYTMQCVLHSTMSYACTIAIILYSSNVRMGMRESLHGTVTMSAGQAAVLPVPRCELHPPIHEGSLQSPLHAHCQHIPPALSGIWYIHVHITHYNICVSRKPSHTVYTCQKHTGSTMHLKCDLCVVLWLVWV